MKVVFEGNLADAACIDWYIDLSLDYVKQDVEKELHQITGKYVRVTIEEVKEPVKEVNPMAWIKVPVGAAGIA